MSVLVITEDASVMHYTVVTLVKPCVPIILGPSVAAAMKVTILMVAATHASVSMSFYNVLTRAFKVDYNSNNYCLSISALIISVPVHVFSNKMMCNIYTCCIR